MRFSLTLRPMDDRPVSTNDIAQYAEFAENLGYYAIYATDHFYYTNATLHPTCNVAVLASVTERVRLGFSAYQLPLRHPIAAAKELCVLDGLSEGRLIAGLAAGSYAAEFAAFGLDFKRRGAMLEEGLDAVQRLWTTDNTSFAGEFWSFEDVNIRPKPVQTPHPPIWLGTWTAVPRAARRVAKYAAGWQASGLHTRIEDIPKGIAQIEKACADIGRDPAEIGKAYVNAVVHFGSSPEKAWEDLCRQSNRERNRDLCFLGEPKDVIARLETLREHGMDEVSFLLGLDHFQTMEMLAKDVMPHFG
ncbi:MAG: LLM class flavin-dependent oxidoreductase [Alphaproteobacteria bacterium]|nr:LLM class flavin-dependent oxidoreductase [Alphaproteobacteria bacterium]